MPKGKDSVINAILEAVHRALENYSADNVDVVENEETKMLDVIYHNDRCSFPIELGVAKASKANKIKLSKKLNALDVGYCW